MQQHSRLTRRHFLNLGLGATAAAAAPRVLWSQPMAGSGAGDYKALVCVFLYGGADTFNLLVPTSGPEYATYAASRGDLAESLGSLLPIDPITSDGATYGLHGQVPEMRDLFQQGDLALLANVGPLIGPMTKAQFLAGSPLVPPALFSHNDQQALWQAAHADGPGTTGWAGRVLDRMTGTVGGEPLSPAISIESVPSLLKGEGVAPYTLGTEGTEPLEGLDWDRRRETIERLLGSSSHALGNAFGSTQLTAIEIDELLSQHLASAPTFDGLFPNSELGAQLRMVARMISIRSQLGASRQIFFVGTGGFDTHDDQTQLLPGLYTNLSQCMGAFQSALQQVGEASRVVSFSHTEFGRTLSSNGVGSDHGWGGHAFVMGEPVRGRDIYGTMPDLTLEGPDDVGTGRILPTQSVDQMAATLARWFGLDSDALLDEVFPNLSAFAQRDLGFLA